MKSYPFYFLLLFLCLCFRVSAQDLSQIETLLERNHIENTEDGYEEMVNTLLELAANPLNINSVDFDSLKLLFLLSDSQIDQIIAFRKKQGHFIHLNELLLVPGISHKDLEIIQPFITIGLDRAERRAALLAQTKASHELLAKVRSTLPLQEGYRMYSPSDFEEKKEYDRKVANRFHWIPMGSLVKYKLTLGKNLQAGFTLENDAGEAYFTKNQKSGFDFLSAHVKLTTAHFFRQIVLGDYKVQWGQGLVLWGGFPSGKSGLTVANEKAGKGIAAYTSTDENNFLRGVALSMFAKGNLTADLFLSHKKIDANVIQADTIDSDDLRSVSLYTSGYHRNDLECSKKDAIEEFSTGMALHWNSDFCRIGFNALYYNLTPALIIGDREYQKYYDDGNKRYLASVDYKTSYRGIYLFGETALSDNGAFATVNGLRTSTSFISGNIIYRRYAKDYVSRYSAGFGEFSNSSNEEGVYCGVELSPAKELKLNMYYDWFRFFSPRYLSSTACSGWEMLAEATYNHSKFEHRLRYKNEKRPENIKGGDLSTDRMKSEYRYQLNYKHNKQLELRTRLSLSRYNKDLIQESGYMIYQDVIFVTPSTDFKMQYRLAYFKTDSYQSRIYAYENNVLYGYSFPAFMGRGWRTYLNLSWKPTRKINYYLKFGFTIYPELENMSSGLGKVDDNKRYDITLQIRLRI